MITLKIRIVLFFLMLAGATAQITFQDVTIINGVGTTSNTRGIIFTDYDGDGDEDIYLTQYGSNILYSYDKDEEEYNDVASEANVNHSGYGYASTLGDYNNDGYIDDYSWRELQCSLL